LVGNAVGKHMDDSDRKKMDSALDKNPPGSPSTWTNSKTGNSFRVTPTAGYVNANGVQCRDFVQEAVIDDKPQQVRGTACKRSDGSSWDASYKDST
jgi:surface antigen